MSQSKPGKVKVIKGQSQPEIASAAFRILYMVLRRPVLIMTDDSNSQKAHPSCFLEHGFSASIWFGPVDVLSATRWPGAGRAAAERGASIDPGSPARPPPQHHLERLGLALKGVCGQMSGFPFGFPLNLQTWGTLQKSYL